MPPTTPPRGDDVVLRLPVLPASLPVARTLAAAVASQWGFTLDVVDDARLITSELLTIILGQQPGCLTEVTFAHADGTFRVTVHTDAEMSAPSTESFAWLLISELSSDLHLRADATGLTISAAMAPAGTAG